MYGAPDDELDAKFKVYRLTVPDNVHEEYDWAEWKSISSFTGAEDICKMAESSDLQERLVALEAVKSYHGPDVLDFYPVTMTGRELARKFGLDN